MDPQRWTRRLERFLIFRLAVIPIAFVLVAICRASIAPPLRDPALWLLYGLLGFYTFLAVAALVPWPRLRDRRGFVSCQVAIDFVVEAVLIWSTGGVESVFCPLLFATLFNASTLLRGGAVLAFASLSTAFLTLTMIGYQLGHGPAISPWLGQPSNQDPAGAAAHLVALGVALHAVALLSTRLAQGLRSVQSIQEEIIENMAEGLVAVDGKMRILELNGEARRIFDLSPEEACSGRPLEEVFGGEALRPVREAFVGSERRRLEFELDRPRGGVQPVEAKISSAPEGGGLGCRIGLFGDLTLKKGIEAAEKRIHRLEEIYQMALGIAHEIRNPLASIRGCVQEISRLSHQGPTGLRLVDIICRESDRLDRIIEDFMSSARQGPVDLQPSDLAQIVEETVVQLRNHPRVGSRRIVLEPPREPARIAGDFPKLKQVFLNLGINAIDATDPLSGEIRFSFRDREFLAMNRRRAGERRLVPGVEVEVADNGSGMRPEVERLVFTPFFTTKDQGHGLGLAIVHRIVYEHFGAVDVETAPGKGTRFKVWFPRLGAGGASPARASTSEVVHV